MCADLGTLAAQVRELDAAGADRFHLDVMDGVFVPNYALGLQDVEAVRAATAKPLDCHLMVANPLLAVEVFSAAGADIMHAHVESTDNIGGVLARMVERGVSPGVAISPDTPLSAIDPHLDAVANVLVMTVQPGFAGQAYLDFVDSKIEALVALRAERPITITVDGGISPERVARLSGMGVDGFVLGTSALFRPGGDFAAALGALR